MLNSTGIKESFYDFQSISSLYCMEAPYIGQSVLIRWKGRHSNYLNIERGVRQGCILIQHLFNVYTDSVVREAHVDELRIKTGGKLVYTLRNAFQIPRLTEIS